MHCMHACADVQGEPELICRSGELLYSSKPGCAQEELQREVARQFALLRTDSWHHVDASLSVEQVEAEVRQTCAGAQL